MAKSSGPIPVRRPLAESESASEQSLPNGSDDSSSSMGFWTTYTMKLGATAMLDSKYELPDEKPTRRSNFARASVVSQRLAHLQEKEKRRESAYSHDSKSRFDKNSNLIQKPQILSIKRSYEYTRNVAITQLQCEIIRKLQVMYHCNACKVWRFQQQELPNQVFRWFKEDFLLRRNLKNIVWIDVLQRDIPADCLELQKMNVDLEELLKLLTIIFNAFEGKEDVHKAVECIEDAFRFLKIQKAILAELEVNHEAFRKGINEKLAMGILKREPKQEMYKLELEESLMDYDIYALIEMRYQVHYHEAKADQNELSCDKIRQDYEREIEKYNRLARTEQYCTQCSLNTYYMQIEKYKVGIQELSVQYEKENEEIENTISYKKLSMDKLRAQRKFFKEQITRFHEELEEMRLREIHERELELLKEPVIQLAKKTKQGKAKPKKGRKSKK